MDFVEKAREFVESECKKSTSKFGYDPYLYHFTPVVKFATQLSDELGGDKEVILIAAWMHDIGSIIYGRKDHHLTGSKIAEKKLKKWGYSGEKVELVKKCIQNHRGSVNTKQDSIEEKIVSDADAMSNFENIAGILKPAMVYEGKSQSEANQMVYDKLMRKYKKIHFQRAKEIIQPKYEAMKVLFS